MYTNTSCTLYLKKRGYAPLYIDKCFLTHRKIYTANKGGINYNESAFVMFKFDDKLEITETEDYIIEGYSTLAFNATNEKSRAEAKQALKDAGAYSVYMADYKGYGSQSMRHWELSCK